MEKLSPPVDPIRRVREHYATEIAEVRERVLTEAREMVWEDFGKIDLTGRSAAYRGNAVGLALLDARLYGTAAEFYQWLVGQAEAYFESSADTRIADIAPLYRNWGIALALQGDRDRGIALFLTAKEAGDRNPNSYDQSVADNLLDQHLEGPALYILGSLTDDIFRPAYRKRLSEDQVRQTFLALGDGRYPVYGSVLASADLWRQYRGRPTVYTRLLVLNSLRTQIAAIESFAKEMSPQSKTLRECYTSLFLTRPSVAWATTLDQLLPNTSYHGIEDFELKLKRLVGSHLTGDDAFYARSLSVTLLLRNFISHQLLPSPNLISDELLPDVKRNLAASFIALYLSAGLPRSMRQG